MLFRSSPIAKAYPPTTASWKKTKTEVQTAGVPPKEARRCLPAAGWMMKSRNADQNARTAEAKRMVHQRSGTVVGSSDCLWKNNPGAPLGAPGSGIKRLSRDYFLASCFLAS